LSFMNAKMEKVCSFSMDSGTETMAISTNFIYPLSLWVHKALLLITYHNLVIGLVSNSSFIALSVCIFIVNLNIHICMSKMLAFEGFVVCKMKASQSLFHYNVFWWHQDAREKMNQHHDASKIVKT
jgi:hypothetical protein